jgi:hypothetical protein
MGLPFAFCLPLFAVGASANGELQPAPTLFLGCIAIAFPLTAFTLGLLALRNIEGKPDQGGRALALTGTVTGGVGVLWCLVVYSAVLLKNGGG